MDMTETTLEDWAWDDEIGRKVVETYIAFEEEIMRVRDLLKVTSDVGDDGSTTLRAMQQCLEATIALRERLEREAIKEAPPR